MTPVNWLPPHDANAGKKLLLPGDDDERECLVDLWQPFQRKTDLSFLALRRFRSLLRARPFPDYKLLRFSDPGSRRWVVYFCYAPAGRVRNQHRFTLNKLKYEGYAVLLVCATAGQEQAKEFLALDVDGVIWKALPGYDFSGYSLGIDLLARRCPGRDVLVMNDSILGPFHPLRPLLDSTPWDLTGFLNSYSVENHIISFAFHLKSLSPDHPRGASKVLFRRIAFDQQGPVSLWQETRLAAVLSKEVSTGSILTPAGKETYLALGNPKGLVAAGFPFLKRSIFTKFAEGFDQGHHRKFLRDLGHPDPD